MDPAAHALVLGNIQRPSGSFGFKFERHEREAIVPRWLGVGLCRAVIDNRHLFVRPARFKFAANRVAIMTVRLRRRELARIPGVGRQSLSTPLNIASFGDITGSVQREGVGVYEIACFSFGVV